MKVRLAQFNPVVGDVPANAESVLAEFQKADEDGLDLLITTELVTCGYPSMDLLERKAFIDAIQEANNKLIESTADSNTALLFGTVTPSPENSTRRLCNSAILAGVGKELARINKTLLPNYDVFDEYRYFEPNTEFKTVTFGEYKLGITICEDIWFNQNEYNYHEYQINPADKLKELGAEVLINISASPFSRDKPELRRQMLFNHAQKLNLPILYSNQCGANTEIIFDGDSMALDATGAVVARAALFESDSLDVQLKPGGKIVSLSDKPVSPAPESEESAFHALRTGLADYLKKTGLNTKVVLGLSGGIDSALTAVIASEAVGAENVTGVTMPSEFSSAGSIIDSEKLAENLGIQLHQLEVDSINKEVLGVLQPLFENSGFSVAEENIQSRIRGMLIMALSNKFGHFVLNTGNKSELAVGYCTLYGDMAGGLSILADVYKTEVYAISEWVNQSYYGKEVIPQSIISKPPSAELRPGQQDSDSLPEYDILDAILINYIEQHQSASEIVEQGFDPETVKQTVRLVDLNEYKRKQAPPALRLSSKAFGAGRRFPIVQNWTSKQLQLDSLET